jgi:hypothetical protein
MTIRRSTLEHAWNLVPVLRQPTFTATDLIRSYDALLDLWHDDGEHRHHGTRRCRGFDVEGLRNDLTGEHAQSGVATAASAKSIDLFRNLQVICFFLLEMSVLDPGQAGVVATSLESATRILLDLRRNECGVEIGEFDFSVLEDLWVELTSKDVDDSGCHRYRWSVSAASIGVSIVMDRAALGAEAEELWRMAHTPVPKEDGI